MTAAPVKQAEAVLGDLVTLDDGSVGNVREIRQPKQSADGSDEFKLTHYPLLLQLLLRSRANAENLDLGHDTGSNRRNARRGRGTAWFKSRRPNG